MFFYLGAFALVTPALLYGLPAVFREPDSNLSSSLAGRQRATKGEGMDENEEAPLLLELQG